MNKVNWWEHTKCGREPGGHKTRELGICPVTTSRDLDGAHGGLNAGRACWIVAGSLCGGTVQETYAQKLANDWRCDFFNSVKESESSTDDGFMTTRLGIERSLNRQRS